MSDPEPDRPMTSGVGHVVVGAVLVGGRSQRFGRDKALADAGGRPLGSVAVGALRAAGADPVVAVGGTAGASLGLPTIPDRRPGEGPLAALATVLLWAREGLVVVTPCDLPLIEPAHIEALIAAAGPNTAAVAELAGRPQPSLACWPASFGPAIQRAVNEGERRWRVALTVGDWLPVPLPSQALADADTPDALASLLDDPFPETDDDGPTSPSE